MEKWDQPAGAQKLVGLPTKPDGGSTKAYAIIGSDCWNGNFDAKMANDFYTLNGHPLHTGSCAGKGYTYRTHILENNCNWKKECVSMEKWDVAGSEVESTVEVSLL